MLPRIQPGMLRRARLLQMLGSDGGAALTVINAPAGYGKTTLLRSWCIERPEPVAGSPSTRPMPTRRAFGRTLQPPSSGSLTASDKAR